MTRPLRRLSRDFAVYGLGEIVIKAFSLVAGFLPSGFQLETLALKVAYCLGFIAAAFVLRAIDGRETSEVQALVARIRR